MDSQKVDLFLAANQKFFSPTQILTSRTACSPSMMTSSA